MRKFSVAAAFSCAVAAVAFFAPAMVVPANPAGALTGKMATMQFLVGSWNCNVKIVASPGQPSTTKHGIVAFSVSPGNTLHSHMTAEEYAADTYSGYTDKLKFFWLTQIDVYFDESGETSKDGKVFVGEGLSTGRIRDTFSRPTPTTTRDLQESKTNGSWHMISDSLCTRI